MVFFFNAFFIVALSVLAFVIAEAAFDFSKNLNQTDPDSQEFTNLANKFKMKFSNASEVSKRLEHFRKSKQNLKEFQSKFKNAKFALNKFSLMSTEEQQKFLGAKLPTNLEIFRNKRSAINNIIDKISPASYDFRTLGKVTPIKNQQQCGSCWSFTATAAIESQYLLRYNLSLDLSEQNLVSCSTYGSKCNGGDVIQTLNYVKSNGITTEACQPYTATNGTCSTACNNQKYYVGGYHYYGNDESTFATQLYNYGPATMVFNVPKAFMSYSSGILDMPAGACAANNIGGHGLVIVGYTADYWIAKNSWGTDWGENGFVRFRRGQNFCGMNSQVTTPFLNAAASLPSIVTPKPTTKTPTPAKCLDVATNCVTNKKLCTDSVYRELMTQKCALTCNFCSGAANTCSDSAGTQCVSMSYLCNDQVYYNLMTQQCTRTCGRC